MAIPFLFSSLINQLKLVGGLDSKASCRSIAYSFGSRFTYLDIDADYQTVKDVVWDIFVFALGNTPGFHLIRAKVCSVFKLKFALNIPYYVYLFLETRHTISRCHIATHFDLKACPSMFEFICGHKMFETHPRMP